MLRAGLLALLLCAAGSGALAASSQRLCDREAPLTAAQQDRLLRFAAVIKRELDDSGASAVLIARSGLNLERFRIRYSHAGISLKASDNGPWSVRQLYYACEERAPRLYDQGMAGFVFGTDDPAVGYVSIVLLPRESAAAIERAALERPRALRLAAGTYSANAYPFSLRYLNCNQWVMELIASAWGSLADDDELRPGAQAWLAAQRYEPGTIEVGSHALMLAGAFIPWVHYDDQPEGERYALRFRTSLPTSIEAFVRSQVPEAQRIELCHNDQQIVVRRGWTPIADGCISAPGDRVIAF
jgi:hypothetical protein